MRFRAQAVIDAGGCNPAGEAVMRQKHERQTVRSAGYGQPQTVVTILKVRDKRRQRAAKAVR